jgi:2-methylisocitrate lyase-like PEP mutase family enzyme
MKLTRRGEALRELHRRWGIFAIPNPREAGSAIALALVGLEALASTSA